MTTTQPVERWDGHRWQSILERIEHRQAGVGLRFCGPPLWLEVTMEGPDSDAWSTADAGGSPDQSWDWQSSAACEEAMALAAAGADDTRLLGSASRYTLENLVLNAVHEIGEWLRFDARRLFPAHGSPTVRADGSTGAVGDGRQGNGMVNIDLAFDREPEPPAGGDDDDPATRLRMTGRASELAGAWRFTYLPGTSISYGPRGPVVTRSPGGEEAPSSSGPGWSAAALGAVDASATDFVAAVERDVHLAVVLHEAARVGDAFHVDGRRPWRLRGAEDAPGEPTPTGEDRRPVAVSVSYRPETAVTAER